MAQDAPVSVLHCQECNEALPRASPGGLCPRCLMGGILAEHDPSASHDESLLGDLAIPAPPTAGPDLMEGVRVGRYKILQRIGEGGFGMVYMAEQVESVHRRVALKIIKAGMDTRQVIARFEAERQALAMMEHPNIARVLDVGETEEGRPYFVMELVKGMPITTYCQEEKLDTAKRLNLFAQVCGAVQHAHMKGIIHRDLKPSNILVTLHDGEPVPKVIDFGIAKAMDQRLTDKTLFTRYDHMVGTPAYMSPEQAALSGLDVDTRSDVYALGVLLYELLTGTTPFDSETLRQAAFDEMRRIIREDQPPKPSTRLTAAQTGNSSSAKTPVHLPPSEIARDLDWIVMKALEKDRGRRYDTAAGLAQDIERFTRNEPVTAGPPGVGYKLRKLVARNRVPATAAALVAITLVCAVIFTTWGMVRAVSAEKKAQENASLTREAGEHAEREAARAIEAEKQATAEAEIAKAINDFLRKDLLMQASPEVNGNRELTFRTVLDRVSGLVAERFEGQPILEAEVRFTLAEVYFEIQDRQAYATGTEHAHRAHDLFQSLLGKRDPKSMRAEALSLAHDSLDVKIVELARPEALYRICSQLRDVAEHQGAILGPSHSDTLTTKYYLAGRTSSLERQSLAESLPDLDTIEDLDGLLSAIGVLSLIRRDSESIRETLEIARQKLGEHHVATLKTSIQLGDSLVREENYLAAEAVFKEVVPLWRRAFVGFTRYGKDPGQGYAKALFHLGKKEEAQTILKEWLESLYENKGSRSLDGVETGVFCMLMGVQELDKFLKSNKAQLTKEEDKLLAVPISEATTQTAILLVNLARVYGTILNRESEPAWKDKPSAGPWASRVWPEPYAKLREEFIGRELACAERAREIFEHLKPAAFEREYGNVLGHLGGRYNELLVNDAPENTAKVEDLLKIIHCDIQILQQRLLRFDDREILPGQHYETRLRRLDSMLGKLDSPQSNSMTMEDHVERIADYFTNYDEDVSFLDNYVSEYGLDDLGDYAILQVVVERTALHKSGSEARQLVNEILATESAQVVAYRADLQKSESLANWVRPHLIELIEDAAAQHALPDNVFSILGEEQQWFYLHPIDGRDPAQDDGEFHLSFCKASYDAAEWEQVKLSKDDASFGYGDPVHVEWETPPEGQRGSAYLRHEFTVDRSFEEVWLQMQCDDGAIIYLDGKEAGRFNILPAEEERYRMPVREYNYGAGETTTRTIRLKGALSPGRHLLAISLHNHSATSSDLRLAEVRLYGVPLEEVGGQR